MEVFPDIPWPAPSANSKKTSAAFDYAVYVILDRSKLPTREQWQQAITAFGFALRLEGDFEPAKSSALMRCRYQDIETGFEYSITPLEQAWLEKARIKDAGGRNCRIRFTDMERDEIFSIDGIYDWIARDIGAAALCFLAGGLLIKDPGFQAPVEADQAMAYGRNEEAWTLRFFHDPYATSMFNEPYIAIKPVLLLPRYQELLAREVEIYVAINKSNGRGDAEKAELDAIGRELLGLVEGARA